MPRIGKQRRGVWYHNVLSEIKGPRPGKSATVVAYTSFTLGNWEIC